MFLPKDDEIKERGVRLCIEAVYEFFCLAYPEVKEEKEIELDLEHQLTMYHLSDSDEDYVRRMAKQWGIDLDVKAINLPSLEELEKGALEYVNQFKQREQNRASASR